MDMAKRRSGGGRREMAWPPGQDVSYSAKEALPRPPMPPASSSREGS